MITDKYNNFLEELKSNSSVKILTNLTKEKLKTPSIEALKGRKQSIIDLAKIQMSDDDFVYFQLGGVSVAWESNVEDVENVLSGGFIINGITDALCSNDDFWRGAAGLPLGKEVPENLKHYEQLNWFEHQVEVLDGRYGCFIRKPGKFPPPIAFYNGGWYKELKMSFEEYLTAMFDTYAVRGWQFFYIELTPDIPLINKALNNMKVASEMLPQIFPNKDWSYHINRYNEVKKYLVS